MVMCVLPTALSYLKCALYSNLWFKVRNVNYYHKDDMIMSIKEEVAVTSS